MTVYVSMPLVPGVLAYDDAELAEVQDFFTQKLNEGGVMTFTYPGDNLLVINMSRIPYINVRPFKIDGDEGELGLLNVSFEEIRSQLSS